MSNEGECGYRASVSERDAAIERKRKRGKEDGERAVFSRRYQEL